MDSAGLFDGDRISQLLFAAGESLGAPDPFLARELSDSVLHFLRGEFENARPTPLAVLEAIEKIVGELGHPRLARALGAGADEFLGGAPAERQPAAPTLDELSRRWLAPRLREWSLANVFPPQLAAAIDQGLLAPGGLETPLRLAGGYTEWGTDADPLLAVLKTVETARARFSAFVAADAESLLHCDAQSRLAAIASASRLAGLRVLLHCNRRRDHDPVIRGVDLFGQPTTAGPDSLLLAEELLNRLDDGEVEVVIHLGEFDWQDSGLLRDLVELVQRKGGQFFFDRPRRPTWLAEGLPDDSPAVLTTVRLNLAELLALPGAPQSVDAFQVKLGSMARLALAVGHAWLDHLRRMGPPGVHQGFLSERAVLVVYPTGLSDAAAGLSVPETDQQAFVRRCWQLLRQALADDRPRGLKAVLTGDPYEGRGSTLPAEYRHFDGAALRLTEAQGRGCDVDWLRACWRESDLAAVTPARNRNRLVR